MNIFVSLLKRLTRDLPKREIPTRDGSGLYLERWLLAGPDFGEPGRKAFIHHFCAPDDEPPGTLHTHPFKRSLSVVLSGSYHEERIVKGRITTTQRGDVLCCRKIRWFNWLPGDSQHRIACLHGDVWTLFLVDEKKDGEDWGFYTPEGYRSAKDLGIRTEGID